MWLPVRLQFANLFICYDAMIENWRRRIDNGRVNGDVIANLPKAFDCINYNLLIPKLAAFGLQHLGVLVLRVCP